MRGGGDVSLNTILYIFISKDADIPHIHTKLMKGTFNPLNVYPNLRPTVACLQAHSPDNFPKQVFGTRSDHLAPSGRPGSSETDHGEQASGTLSPSSTAPQNPNVESLGKGRCGICSPKNKHLPACGGPGC